MCSNVTKILGSYDKGPASEEFEWDNEFWERKYKSEKELTAIERDGQSCMSPCHQTKFKTDLAYLEKEK